MPSDLEEALSELQQQTPQEGSRSWMGHLRRVSGGAKHRRGVSVASGEPPLLPPIELRPPSPLLDVNHIQSSSESSSSSSGSHAAKKTGGLASSTTASLGRNTITAVKDSSPVPRRNSLGDLKIPARISQAQVGLRRDLGMVREFAKSVDGKWHQYINCHPSFLTYGQS